MKSEVKAIIFFIVTLLVGALVMIGIQNPSLFENFANDIAIFFSSIEISNINSFILIVSSVIAVVLIVLLVVYGIKRKKKQEQKKKRKRRKLKKEIKNNKGASTKIDLLYSNIQEKEKTNLIEISDEFGISKEKALEWSKILEKEGLVEISYPTFKSPEVKLKQEEKDELGEMFKKPKKEEEKEGKNKKTKKPSSKKKKSKKKTAEKKTKSKKKSK